MPRSTARAATPAPSSRSSCSAFADGARYAREALAEPREGTILTLFGVVAAELAAALGADAADLARLLARALRAGEAALRLTEGQLDVLADAHVVDAGAAGFVMLLQGVADYLATGRREARADARTGDARPALPAAPAFAHRYCTECLVTGPAIDRRALREALAALGSSLVVAGSATRVRVHAHVEDPTELFRIAAGFGTVGSEKADDMRRQADGAQHATRGGVAIVTDSGADLPEEEAERLHVHVVPLRVHFGEHSYLDKVALGPEEFYRMLATRAEHPKTSQPPPGDFRRMYGFLGSHYGHVVSLHVTGRASGTRQSAESAAARLATPGSVTVIDSGNASAGQGLLALHAAECAAAGMAPEAIAASVRARMAKTRTFACLRNLDYGVRGGRVPGWARTIANWLHVSPCLKTFPDGRIGIGGFVLGRSEFAVRFARFVLRRLEPGARYRLIVAHADAPAEGAALLERLTAAHGGIARGWLVPLGAAIGVHGGPGTLVVGAEELGAPAP
jgi:DegV family protein with EDD domain